MLVLKGSATLPPSSSLQIELVELETFLAVAELASFSLAAERLHVTQPSVTGRVQRLEEALGTKLLVRTTRKVETTPHGAILFAEATGALTRLRKVIDEIRHPGRLARQRVVVAATPMLAALTMPPIIRAYSQRFPDVQVKLRDLAYPAAVAALDAGTADLAVLAFEGKDNRFRIQPLRSEDVVLVVPENHPLAGRKSVSLEELASCPLLVIEQYEPMWQRIEEEANRRGLTMAPSMSVASLNTLLGMLDAEMGAALLTRSMARRGHQKAQFVVEIEGITLTRNFALVLPRKAKLGTAVQSFCSFLRQAMAPA